MSRYEKASTIITSNRPLDDWAKLLGDVVVVTPLLDRLMHHGHLLEVRGQELAAEGGRGASCQARINRLKSLRPVAGVEEFDPATGGGV